MRPRAQRSGLLVQPVGDQLVVYDQARQRLHVLSRTAAAVWRHCDGRRTAAELIEPVGDELGTQVDESVIALALAQLDEARLLEERLAPAPGEDTLSRREVLHRAAAALVAGVLLPTVTSCGLPVEPTSPGGASLSMHEPTVTTTSTSGPPTTTTTSTSGPPTTTTSSTSGPPTTTTTTTSGPPTTTTTTTSLPPTTTTTTSPIPTTTTTTTTTPAPRKVAMCHGGRTIMVDERAVAGHLAHGDTLGPCR